MRTRRLHARLAYVIRVGYRAKVIYAAATPAVKKLSGARLNAATIADNAKALGYLFTRLAGSRDAQKLPICSARGLT
jgi:hypothetical protein